MFSFFWEGHICMWCGCFDVSHHVCTAQDWNVLNACRMLCGIPISLSAWRWMFPLTAESEFTLWCRVLLGWAAPSLSPSLSLSLSLSLPLPKHAAIHIKPTTQKTHTINAKFTLSESDLVLSLHLNKFHSNGKSVLENYRHAFNASQFIFHDLQHVFTLLFSLPCNGKKATQRDSLSRWKWEFDIVSYRQHLFAGDMFVHWYVQAISSSVWHWWPSCCCKDWQKFSDSQ